MNNQRVASYGSWKSPITAELAASVTQLTEVGIHGASIYWRELHPEQQASFTIMKRDADGQITELVPPPFNVRTTVHEYGGGSYVVDDDTVYFSNFSDQRIYRLDSGGSPRPVTPKVNMRYADGVIDHRLGRLICVREDHSSSDQQAANTIVSLNLDGKDGGHVLVSGNDFYSSPRLTPDGSRIAWITWNHPNMPWDSTELWSGELGKDGSLGEICGLLAAPTNPLSNLNGHLPAYFTSYRTGRDGGISTDYVMARSNHCTICPRSSEGPTGRSDCTLTTL